MNGAGAWERLADRYLRLRWLGIGIFCVAACVLPLRVVLAARGDLPVVPAILPNLATLGISLGAFGTANDTGLFALRQLESLGKVPARHAAELAHERATRPERLDAALSVPGVAIALPSIAAVLLSWITWTALRGLLT